MQLNRLRAGLQAVLVIGAILSAESAHTAGASDRADPSR
jgi:hypothetical protein